MFNFLRRKRDSDCFAPSRSIRFNHSGNILACCFNRGNILGKFPDQSIQEVWFGDSIGKLRTAIYQNDFSLGCQSCEKQIRCGNRAGSGAAQYDYLKNWKPYKKYPTMFDFELGSTCNFECIMCSGEYSTAIRINREKQKPYYSPYEDNPQLFVEQLIPFIPHLKEMRFIGGEPFLMKIYYEIWDKVLEINPSITLNVLTNGSILNKRVRNMLEKGNFKIAVSIDSLVKETYEAIRKNGNFEQVMEHVSFFRQLMERNGHTMNFNLCVMRQNWKEIPDYFSYCNENKIQVVLHTVEFPKHCSIWNLSSSELKEILDVYEKITFTADSEISSINNETYKSLIVQIKNWHKKSVDREEDRIKYSSLEVQLKEKIDAAREYPSYNSQTDYYGFILKLCEQFSQEDRMAILSYLLQLDIHLIIGEINVSSGERILEKLKNITQN